MMPAAPTITGISISKHTKLDITGNIPGDIVTNLLPNGRLTDSDNNPANGEDGGILLPYSIKGITTHPLGTENGDLGRIIAGGSVNNINVAGSLSGIYAGNGIFRDGTTATIDVGTVDYNTIVPGVQHIFTLTQANANPASRRTSATSSSTRPTSWKSFAGSGADNAGLAGGVGGSITNITIANTLAGQGAKPALFLHAGDGGGGAPAARAAGSPISTTKIPSPTSRFKPATAARPPLAWAAMAGRSWTRTSRPVHRVMTCSWAMAATA